MFAMTNSGILSKARELHLMSAEGSGRDGLDNLARRLVGAVLAVRGPCAKTGVFFAGEPRRLSLAATAGSYLFPEADSGVADRLDALCIAARSERSGTVMDIGLKL
jgi:hypothetical protein